ncbi:MAG: TIGR01177 family methyltransferase [Methanobacterium sp.]|jgi:tRNA (guanine10-N2)-dimethyltransferase|uniref:tRNA (guanine(10)-N(2))-dimethyltransferase n=1 Tax=Methanobacterium subterraneum TaxID=59277 RepID=A0A2H4VT67_9EURY|nr:MULTISPECIES: TIGR01177 family methyltransferase [Methanobacterium]AUB61304.1 tRNA (guanine-N2)-dimethyltransferase [Methanobacterium subterraneum]MCC7560444.1 TIGR01177 family methyltransferase [Methanobacterium sp.]
MEIALLLSKEHPTLPLAEVRAVLECEGIKYYIKEKQEGLLILEIPLESPENMSGIIKRLSFTHEVFQILIEVDEEQLLGKTKEYPWDNIVKSDYAVRVKKMDKKSHFNTSKLEWEMGSIIKDNVASEIRVNLENPSTFIRTVLINGKAFVGQRMGQISKKHFFDLKPHKRPFFYPGSMSPKLARGMVNLTRIRMGETLLDPFCGTGGILIEAGIIGARVIGTDIDYKMVKGSIENLQHCGIHDYQVFQEDARKLELPSKVDAIVTDPPYGISASTRGEKSQDLYQQSMQSLQELLKEDGHMCLATPHYLDLDGVLEGTKFKIIEQHHIRMHKSLTRVISVLAKI